MQYNRYGTWTYQYGVENEKIATAYNDGSSTRVIKSITLYMGVGKSGQSSSSAYGDVCPGTGKSVTIKLTPNKGSSSQSSNWVTIDSPLQTATPGYYSTSGLKAYTFSFDGILINPGQTISFYVYSDYSGHYPNTYVVHKTDIDGSSDAYNPHVTPSVWVYRPDGVAKWTKQGTANSAYYEWNRNGDTHSHKIEIWAENSATGKYTTTSSSGSGSGTYKFNTPTKRDIVYKVQGKITDTNDTSYYDTDYSERGVYGLPSISVSLANSNKILSNTTNRITVSVGKLNNDTGNNTKVWIKVNETEVKNWTSQSTGSTHTLTYDYTPTSGDTTYNVVATLEHYSSKEQNSASKSFKTYVDPVINTLEGVALFSPQDDVTFTWTSNSSTITNRSETYAYSISILNATSYSISSTATSLKLAPNGTNWVQSIFNDAKRSINVLISKLTLTLTNTSSNRTTTKTFDFNVQYQPVKALEDVVVSNQGDTVSILSNPTTDISWTYPHMVGAAGYVSGYRIGVYTDSECTTANLVSERDYTTAYLQNNMTFSLNNDTDLARGVMNYVKIQPYYTYPSDGTKLLGIGDTIYKGELVKPYMPLGPVVIHYPINNTTWHNKNFRILFSLPVDNDYNLYPQEIQEDYHYSNIQIDVNGTIYNYSNRYISGAISHPEIFSKDPILSDNITASLKQMAINPSLISNFADANTFVVKVRVQKCNYFFTEDEMSDEQNVMTWSDWATVTINKTDLALQNLTKGSEITAAHYMYVHNAIERCLACYPIGSNDERNITQVAGDRIDRSEYQGIYQTILNLIDGVNNWCTYERPDVKFNSFNVPISGDSNTPFTALVEIITANMNDVDEYGSTGRNYMNILTHFLIDYLK